MTIFKNVYIFRKQNCLFCTVYKINTLHFNKRNFVYKSTVQYKISQYKMNTELDPENQGRTAFQHKIFPKEAYSRKKAKKFFLKRNFSRPNFRL